MPTLEQYAAEVTSHIGFHEGADNYTPFGVWFGEQVGDASFSHSAWCDEFTCYCGDRVGARALVGLFAWTPGHAGWFVRNNRWSVDPVRGGIAFWDWSGIGSHDISRIDHVSALIESVDGDGQAVTVDGNYSDRVDRWRHSMACFVGCGIPAWDTTVYNPQQSGQQEWDGSSFPGASAFVLGSPHPAVTKLGERLVAHGYGRFYKVGPGIPMGQADVAACHQFQLDQGWTGADADGYPGQETWNRLMADPAGPPPPPPAPVGHGAPQQQGPHGWVYMSKLFEGSDSSDSVRHYQQAARDYPDVPTQEDNPSGVTGHYGSETVAMTERLYRTFNEWQPGAGWADGDLSVPGRQLCRILGLDIRD